MKYSPRLSLLAALALAACNAGALNLTTADIPSTPAPLNAELLDLAEAQWLKSNVREYAIQVQTVSLWHVQTHELVVKDGEVTSSSAACITAPLEFGRECTVEAFEAADFTVPGLFAKARTLVGEKWARAAFDSSYYYPSSIGFNNPEIYDEEWGWRVVTFEARE
jgi:hypothetical protein